MNVRSVNGRKAYAYRGPFFWNNLDGESRNMENKAALKSHITELIFRDKNHPR